MKTLFAIICLLSIVGCRSIFKDDPNRKFPSHIKPQAHGALNRSKEIIDHVGVHKVKPRDVLVTLIPGEKKLGGQWAWHVPDVGWVYGLCSFSGVHVKVAVNPHDKNDFNMGTLVHEMGHHWHFSNGHKIYHDPIYDPYFNGWATSRRVSGRAEGKREIEGVPEHEHLIHIDENGEKWLMHIAEKK